MITLKRTNSEDNHFHELVRLLDKDLQDRYGALQDFYSRFNSIQNLPTVVLAYYNEQPVGCGCFKHFDDASVEVKRMYVSNEQRGKGIGATILAELEKWAAESGIEFTVLETGYEQPEAIHLYKKQGYLTIPNYGPYIGNEEFSICMKKRIL